MNILERERKRKNPEHCCSSDSSHCTYSSWCCRLWFRSVIPQMWCLTNSLNRTWELARNTNSRALSQTYWISNKPPEVTEACSYVRTTSKEECRLSSEKFAHLSSIGKNYHIKWEHITCRGNSGIYDFLFHFWSQCLVILA